MSSLSLASTLPASQTVAAGKAGVSAATPAPIVAAGRSADGDYKVRSAATAQVKDADGDYKPAVQGAAATSSSAVMAAVTALTKGG